MMIITFTLIEAAGNADYKQLEGEGYCLCSL